MYNFNVFYSGSNVTGTTRFILKEGRFFEAPTSIPDRQLRYDMGRNYQAGFQVHFDYTFQKHIRRKKCIIEQRKKSIELQ